MAFHKILKTFLDGRDRYVEGELRWFEEEPTSFAKEGWVFVEGVTPAEKLPAGDVTLDIQNVSHDTTIDEVSHG